MATAAETLTRGWQLHQRGDWVGAERLYRSVLQQHPGDANAWCYLGMICHDQDRLGEAVDAYRRAIRLQPHFPIAYNNLGNTLRLQRRLREAIACFDKALQQQPGYVNAYKNKGTALVWEGHLDQALTAYRQALAHGPEDAETHKNLGVIYLLQGRFAEGWPEYRWRWRTAETPWPAYQGPCWEGEDLRGRTLLLVAEQGLGDTIHFIRYAAVLKQRYGCRVIAVCPAPLRELLTGCAGLDGLLGPQDKLPPYDVWCPLLEVPAYLGETLETIPANVPYLQAPAEWVASWRQRWASGQGMRIGVVWQGNPQYPADRMRSFPLLALEPLAHLNGIELISLQKGAGVEQLEDAVGRLEIRRLGDRLDEDTGAFVETAAVMKNLDLVIAADTAAAHLAGALGVPLWVALAHVPHWPWLLERPDSPWYPSARLFRQPVPGDWRSVFESMARALRECRSEVHVKRPAQFRVISCGPSRLTRARYGLMLYNRHDPYIGRSLATYGECSEAECQLLRQLVKPGQVVVEAGAHIGAHTLPLSQWVGSEGRVIAFEPQRIVFQNLCANLALNARTNVECHPRALGERAGTLRVPPIDYTSSVNTGGVALSSGPQGESVEVVTIDSLHLPACHLVKVDVEGMELEVLRGGRETLARHRPLLYVENDREEKSAALIEYLLGVGYHLYWHLPPLFQPRNFFDNPDNVFPGVVSANMLGVPSSVPARIEGLQPIRGPESRWQSASGGSR